MVLVGLLVAADFGAAALFEYQVSKRARTTFGLADDPSVRVGGFSFLAQALSGRYPTIDVDATGIPVQDTLTDIAVHATLHDVTAPLSSLLSGSSEGVGVAEADGEIRIKATDVNRVLQRNLTPAVPAIKDLRIAPVSERVAQTPGAEDEEPSTPEVAGPGDGTAGVKLGATVTVAGEETDIDVYAIISLDGGTIAVSPKRLAVRGGPFGSGELPEPVQRAILPLFAISLDPGDLPFNVTPVSVGVTPEGLLTVAGRAKNVTLNGTG